MGSQRVGYNWATNTFTFTYQVNWGIMTLLEKQFLVILMKLLEKTKSFKKPNKVECKTNAPYSTKSLLKVLTGIAKWQHS